MRTVVSCSFFSTGSLIDLSAQEFVINCYLKNEGARSISRRRNWQTVQLPDHEQLKMT